MIHVGLTTPDPRLSDSQWQSPYYPRFGLVYHFLVKLFPLAIDGLLACELFTAPVQNLQTQDANLSSCNFNDCCGRSCGSFCCDDH
jgi:hypothetical protein